MISENIKKIKVLFSSSRAEQILLAILLVFSLVRFFVDGFALEIMGRSSLLGYDFQIYYLAGKMLQTREDIYNFNNLRELAQQDPTIKVKEVSPYIYPPLLAIILMPLSYLPFSWAYPIWVLCQQAFLIASLSLLAKSLPALGTWIWPFLIVLAVNMYPVHLTIDIGQINLLILLILCLVLYLAQRDHFFWAGIMVGVATMIKMSPLLLLGLFIFQRKWRAVVGVFAALIILTALSIALAGPQNMLSFFSTSLRDSILIPIEWINNVSPAAFLHQLLPALGLGYLEVPSRLAIALVWLSLIAVFSYRQLPQTDLAFTLLFSLWVTAMLLISPITWEHHLVMLLPAFGAAITALVSARHFSIMLLVWLSLTYTLIAFENLITNRFGEGWMFHGNYLHDYFYANIRLLGLISLFALLIILLRHVQRETSALAEAPQ